MRVYTNMYVHRLGCSYGYVGPQKGLFRLGSFYFVNKFVSTSLNIYVRIHPQYMLPQTAVSWLVLATFTVSKTKQKFRQIRPSGVGGRRDVSPCQRCPYPSHPCRCRSCFYCYSRCQHGVNETLLVPDTSTYLASRIPGVSSSPHAYLACRHPGLCPFIPTHSQPPSRPDHAFRQY